MKCCFITLGVFGFLAITAVVIVIIVLQSGSHTDMSCPPYHFYAEKDEVRNTDIERDSDSDGVCVKAHCDFRTEIMTDGGMSCEKCGDGMSVNWKGTECIQDSCTENQFINQDDECEECPAEYSKSAGKCFQADRAKIEMVKTFETNPDFAHYSNVHRTTQNIAMFFDEKSKNYKGMITRPFKDTGVPTDSPMVDLIKESQVTHKMYFIHQVQEEPNSPYFMDIWFINTNDDRETT